MSLETSGEQSMPHIERTQLEAAIDNLSIVRESFFDSCRDYFKKPTDERSCRLIYEARQVRVAMFSAIGTVVNDAETPNHQKGELIGGLLFGDDELRADSFLAITGKQIIYENRYNQVEIDNCIAETFYYEDDISIRIAAYEEVYRTNFQGDVTRLLSEAVNTPRQKIAKHAGRIGGFITGAAAIASCVRVYNYIFDGKDKK